MMNPTMDFPSNNKCPIGSFSSFISSIKSKIEELKKHKAFLINAVLEKRKKAALKIECFFERLKSLRKIRDYYLIQKIIMNRREAAIKIQRQLRYFILSKKIHILNLKISNCYQICCSISNVTKIDIKIFLSSKNFDKYTIVSLKFCPLRKFFVLDFPKIKFNKNKICYFNFIINGNTVIDSSYESVYKNDTFVNVIDFSKVDKQIAYLRDIYYPKFVGIKKPSISLMRSKSTGDEETCLSSEEEYSNLRGVQQEAINPFKEKLSDDFSMRKIMGEEFEGLHHPRKRLSSQITPSNPISPKSILKSNFRLNYRGPCSTKRRVSFGSVEFSLC